MDDTSLPPEQVSTPIQQIDRASLHDQIIEHLREMIYDGDLEPGIKVPEKRLCETLGVSRTPLREALKVLASEGLVELLPNRGARVAQLTAKDVDEMFPVMGALEALAGELACQNMTPTQLAEIRALHYQMALHFQKGERPGYFACNQKIHEAIMTAAGNDLLAVQYKNLAGRIRRARYVASLSEGRWEEAMEEHEQILKALEDRDGAMLAHILKTHLKNKCETVKETLLAAE